MDGTDIPEIRHTAPQGTSGAVCLINGQTVPGLGKSYASPSTGEAQKSGALMVAIFGEAISLVVEKCKTLRSSF